METAVLERPSAEAIGEKPALVSYKDFKEIDLTEKKKIIIENMPPAKLYSSQDWVDPEKLRGARMFQDQNTSNKGVVAEGYWHVLPTGRRIVILGNGHHKTLLAWENGDKVNIKIMGAFPEGKPFITFSQFRNIVGRELW